MIHYSHNTLTNKGRILVMCSGGVDSVAGLHFMWSRNKNVEAFHFNHQQRPQNEEMMRSVGLLCKDKGITANFTYERDFPIDKTRGFEKGAANARLEALGAVCAQRGITKVVSCHHLDDCVESYLMRCLATGCGNWKTPLIHAVKSEHIVYNAFMDIYRPFLKTKKKDLERYVDKHDLRKYIVEDETNKDPSVGTRNYIRNLVLPIIQDRFNLYSKVKKCQQEI